MILLNKFLKKSIFSCYLKIKNLLISMTEFHKIHLMDVITYKRQRCFVNNGTKSDSNGNRLWDILPEEFDENGRRSGWAVPRSEFRRVFCWFNRHYKTRILSKNACERGKSYINENKMNVLSIKKEN